MNKRIGYIDTIKQLRLPLIVLITFAHSYSGVRVGYTLWGDGWDTYEVLKIVVSQTLCKVAMPTFFVMSGYLFFANVTEWNAKTYLGKLRRRVKTLLIPYIVWNLLMAIKLKTFSLNIFWAFWTEAGKQTDWVGNEQLMTAPVNMPLWFLRDLMVVALFTYYIYRYTENGWLAINYPHSVLPFWSLRLHSRTLCLRHLFLYLRSFFRNTKDGYC